MYFKKGHILTYSEFIKLNHLKMNELQIFKDVVAFVSTFISAELLDPTFSILVHSDCEYKEIRYCNFSLLPGFLLKRPGVVS